MHQIKFSVFQNSPPKQSVKFSKPNQRDCNYFGLVLNLIGIQNSFTNLIIQDSRAKTHSRSKPLSDGFEKTLRIDLGYRCGSGCIDHIFWRNWLIVTVGPNWVLDSKSILEAIPIAGVAT